MKEVANTHTFVSGLVSIIVPVFNSEKYLCRCIESIINQSYKNSEIILINDGSSDNSGGICDEYARRDNRIRVIHTKNNDGPAAARNAGIGISKGEFIFFVDADDFIENDALSLIIENDNQYKADIIIGTFKKIKKGVVEKRNDIVFSSNKLLTKRDIIDYSRRYLAKPNKYLLFAFVWGRLFKSSIIKDNNILFNTDLYTSEDHVFNFDYLNYTNEIYFFKKEIYNYIIHDNYDNYLSATMTNGGSLEKLFGYKQAIVNISNFLKNSITDAEIKKEVGHAYIFLTIIQLVRICGQINNNNKKTIYQLTRELINDSNLRDNLQFYSPSKGDSKIIPVLMKLKLVWLIIFVCKYKANRRYAKRSVLK